MLALAVWFALGGGPKIPVELFEICGCITEIGGG